MNCQEITTKINKIKTKKAEFDSVVKTDIPRALILKKELQLSINELKEILNPVFRIDGKEFLIFQLEIGGKTIQEIENELKKKNINLTEYTQYVLHSRDFTTLPNPEQIGLVRIKVSDLGFPDNVTNVTIDELYPKALELGLELCPAEAGLYQRLKDSQQALGDWYSIAMKPISDGRGNSGIFNLEHDVKGLWFGHIWTKSVRGWSPDEELMFQVPKK